MIELIIASGSDYRELLTLLPEEGYECDGKGGHEMYKMSDGTRAVYRIEVDIGLGETHLYDFVQGETEGKVEARVM